MKIRKINKTESYAKKYMTILIICVGCLNHFQIVGTNLAVVSTVLYILLFLLDILMGRNKFDGTFLDGKTVRKTKYFVYLFIVYISLQTLILYFLYGDNDLLNNYLLMVVNLFLFLSVINHTNNKDDLIRYANCVVICSVVEVIICIYEIRTGLHVRDVAVRRYSDVVFGTYYNENDLCVMLALGILCLVYLASYIHRSIILKFFLAFVCAAGMLFMIFKTHARGGLLGVLLLGMLLLLAVLFGRNYILTGKAFKIGNTAVILFLIILFATGIVKVSDENDVARMNIYMSTIKTMLDSPMSIVFGFGSGQLTNAVGMATHNYVLQLLGEYGVIGTCLYIWLVAKMMRWPSLRNVTVSNTIRKTCSYSAALLLLCFGLVTSNFGKIKLGWVVFGIFYAYSLHDLKESKDRLIIESKNEETINY